MLIHWSFAADDPALVADTLAELLGGEVVEPPVPPYSPGAKWVCLFNEWGTLLEVAPRNAAWVPDPEGVAPAVETLLPGYTPPAYTYNHTLWKAAVSKERIVEVATKLGWKTVFFDGPFKFQAIWVENHQYLELCPPDLLHYYTDVFGPGASKEKLEAHNQGRGHTYEDLGTKASQTAELR